MLVKIFLHIETLNSHFAIFALFLDEGDTTCSVVISLMQEYRRSNKRKGVKLLQTGFVIYRIPDHTERHRQVF